LVSQFFFDLRVDLFDGKFFFTSKSWPPVSLKSFEHFLSVRVVLLDNGLHRPSSFAVTAVASITAAAGVAISILSANDREDRRVGSLRGELRCSKTLAADQLHR
jgi:hypothetical protein